jgi:predicted RNA methylase
MIAATKTMIRALVPASAINWLYDRWVACRLWVMKWRIIRFLERDKLTFPAAERALIVSQLKRHKIAMIPYELHVDPAAASVGWDSDAGCGYALHEGKRLYFIRGRSEDAVRRSYASLLREQLAESPHRYTDATCDVEAGDVVVDVGAAEGIFALSVIERASKVYLVECEPSWIDALRLTFAPYRDKVEIVAKYVADRSDGQNRTTLDDLLQGRPAHFIKADIEGAEMELLRGAERTLAGTGRIKLALCAYHNESDADEMRTYLEARGFDTRFSPHFMILHQDLRLRAPWLRQGVLRAVKRNPRNGPTA